MSGGALMPDTLVKGGILKFRGVDMLIRDTPT